MKTPNSRAIDLAISLLSVHIDRTVEQELVSDLKEVQDYLTHIKQDSAKVSEPLLNNFWPYNMKD
jgi:hypothetical protein